MVRIVFLLVVALHLSSVQAGEVRVAVASNFLVTLKTIQADFESRSGDRLRISAASTGKLYAQISNGAPFDVLLAADQTYPARLEKNGYIIPGSRFVYATGQLVLWQRVAEPVDANSLTQDGLRYIAIANPRTAPYGIAAKQALNSMGLWDSLSSLFVTGESVGQAFQFVASGNAQFGFVALSQVLSDLNRFNSDYYWRVPDTYYQSLRQEAGLLSKGRGNPAAIRFLEYLRINPQAQRVMQQYGYL